MPLAHRRVLVSIAAWLAGAAASIGIGLLALSLIGKGLTDDLVQPLTAEAMARAIAEQPDPTAQARNPAPTAGAGTSAGAATTTGRTTDGEPTPNAASTEPTVQRLLNSAGGTVLAQCAQNDAYLLSWSPAQGYRASRVRRGPAAEAQVTFKADVGGVERHVVVTVSCVHGTPRAKTTERVEEDG